MPSFADYRAIRQQPVDAVEIIDEKHKLQADFVRDQSRFKAALCGRRGGKSNGFAYWLSGIAANKPRKTSLYVAGSKGEARRNLLPALWRVSKDHDLGAREREQDGQLLWCFPNGHRIWLAGCSDRGEVDKFRGGSEGLSAAVVDEAQKMPFLDDLIDNALIPALVDQSGPLAVGGTPHPVAAGYFYELTTGDSERPQWPTWHWTMLENPYIPHARKELDEMKARFGWSDDHPTLLREWFGQWVKDMDALVYPYSAALNSCVELGRVDHADPEPNLERVQYALVVDLGSSPTVASTAFVLGATIREDPHIYVLSCEKRAGMIPSTIAARIEWYRAKYPQLLVVIDEGGLGGGYASEMREYHGIPCVPAEKNMKRAFQEMMAGDMKSGMIRCVVRDCRSLIDEWIVLPWNEDRTDAADGYPDHASDGALYLRRALRPMYHAERVIPPETEQERMRREAIEDQQRKRKKEWQRSPRDVMRRAMGVK